MKQYTHLEMEAALCVWECINDWTLPDHISKMGRPEWINLRNGVGSVEMRHQSIVLGKWCLQIWDILTEHDKNFFDYSSYDWEVVPMMLDYAEDADGNPVIYEAHFPSPDRVAQLIAHRHLFDWFRRDCCDQASKQWSYRGLPDDHPERTYQAFTLGEEPAEFIKWLGEKYNLITSEEWNYGV